MARLAVVGAGGRTGRRIVERAAAAGDSVVAVVRDPGRAAGLPADSVAVTDARDASGLAEAIHGVDAVVLCVGPVPGQSTTIQHDSAAAVIGAMEETGVRRLIAVSASGWVVDGDDPLTRYLAKPILARVLRDANADFAAMEAVVRASGVDWTLVRPPRLTDAAARGRYRSRRDGNVRWGFSISRTDLAQAVLDLLPDGSSARQTVSVAR